MLTKIKGLFSATITEKDVLEEGEAKDEAVNLSEKLADLSEAFEVKDFQDKFPLMKDDIILIKGGRNYKVCKQTISGAITNTTVTLKWLNKPTNYNQKDKIEEVKFGSLRELNYYVQKDIYQVEDIIKVNWYSFDIPMTVDDAHSLALKINKEKRRIRLYLDSIAKRNI